GIDPTNTGHNYCKTKIGRSIVPQQSGSNNRPTEYRYERGCKVGASFSRRARRPLRTRCDIIHHIVWDVPNRSHILLKLIEINHDEELQGQYP
ncbi:14116_t:CDS:2, partial [Dentiscutata heterogama]